MNKIEIKVLIFLLLGAVYMVTCNGCSGAGKYSKYSSTDFELNITMDYISGWQYSETRGANNSYADVFFGEPWNKVEGKTRRACMEVTSVQSSNTGIDNPTIPAIADDLINKKLKIRNGELLERTSIKLPVGEAVDLKFSLKAMDKLYSIDAKLIPVKERIVIFKKDDRFYTVRYENREEIFDKYEKNFDHIIRSIRFKDKK